MAGGSNQSVTPAIDDNYVYIYDKGEVKGYNQETGSLDYVYGIDNGTLPNVCNLDYDIGCQSKQAIITNYNVFWADGKSVYVFDKQTQKQVIKIENACNGKSQEVGTGNSMAWYGKYLIVTCIDNIVMYQFTN